MITIYYWPDGTWCQQSEYSEAEYGHKGDDFGTTHVALERSDEEIDRIVDGLVS